jgi:PAS domain-containing protein
MAAMRVVCSYCRGVISADPRARVTDVSHGMCRPCAAHFERLWAGMPLGEYLDELGSPVILVDGNGRVLAVNQKLADVLGVDRSSIVGLLGGEALACVRSRLPEGCGRTVHCRDCAVRRAVEEVARTGKPRERVPAYLDRAEGRVHLRISARPCKAGIIQVTVEELAAPRARVADA